MGHQECFSNLARLRQELYADPETVSVGLHYSDVVKVLVDDRQDEGSQLALLLMLQEAGSSYQSEKTAYDAVESLKSAFGALRRTTRYNVQSQTLITMTTIILSHQSADYTQLYELVELLLENVVQVKRNHPLVRAAGCSCLREIEIFHPGFLAKQMEQLWGTLGKDNSWACQALALLLAVGTTTPTAAMGNASDEPARSEVSSLIGYIPLMTPLAAAAVMQSLLANLVGVLPPALLKLCCTQFSLCYDLPLVQLMLTMQGELCREAWWQALRLEVIQRLAHGLHYPESQQALKISWLGSALSQVAGQPNASWHLLPVPRDKVTQQGLRLQATLATGFDAWGGPEKMLDAVIPYLRVLKRHVCLAPGPFGIHLLFYVLYRLYADLRNTTVAALLTEEITRLVINMIMLGPLYCRNLLNFLKCIETAFPESSLSQVVLMEAVDMVTEQNWEDCVQDSAVESCLLVFTAAVQKPGNLCQPKQLFHFIEQLVANRGLAAHRGWLLGNRLIDLCCSVVLHQTNHAVSSDLCTILSYLMDSSEDVDVKSRVKLLYTSLSALSELKARELLHCCSHDPALDSEKDCNVLSDFPLPSPVACSTAEVLRLERLLPNGSRLEPCDQVPSREAQGGQGLCLEELHKYRAFLESDFDHVVSIPCRLVLESPEPRFDCLMGLQLNLAPPEGWGTAQGLEASLFWKSDSGVATSVALSPQTSVPCSIAVRAEFTSLDSCSHVCWLEPLQVRFEDLLLPLPIPQPLCDQAHPSQDTYRAMVWHSLCEQLTGSPEAQSSTLRLGPSPPSQQLWLRLCEGLAPFVVRWQPRGLLAGFVVPKRIHVLLTLEACGPHLIASFLVEDWLLLPRVQTFLQSLCVI
ncbi:uncharacterized protein LOC119379400 isoform X2 [Rhipicephalus sanguineus]|uniref:uncharacterized protein LOC119379400 isoform X2 n=1 Tax=Rhipicephalus sanguineus TaxID=34632 RepID=UPI001892D87E|nr:uncharacterized protein LOC119379400 isoform X2 [Rhipicephalus sanguineus]